jgi:hypothetical protein
MAPSSLRPYDPCSAGGPLRCCGGAVLEDRARHSLTDRRTRAQMKCWRGVGAVITEMHRALDENALVRAHQRLHWPLHGMIVMPIPEALQHTHSQRDDLLHNVAEIRRSGDIARLACSQTRVSFVLEATRAAGSHNTSRWPAPRSPPAAPARRGAVSYTNDAASVSYVTN